MMNFEETAKEKYLKVNYLIENEFKTDPANFPYKSKYEARDILKEMEELLKEKEDRGEKEDAMLSAVYTLNGTISILVEERSLGETYLQMSLDIVKNRETHKYFVLSTLCTLNQLALLYSMRLDEEKPLFYLEKAESLYQEYKELSSDVPFGYHTLFTGEEDDEKGIEMFEKTHTLTLFYKAQAYKACGNSIKAAVYCHNTLRRQLGMKDYDKIDWAINAASLSAFFTEHNAFKEARHHLAAAIYVINLRHKDLEEIQEKNEQYENWLEQYKYRKSDVYRCWVKYCISLLDVSKDRLMETSEIKTPPEILQNKIFPLELQASEKLVPCSYALTYDDAKSIALFGQSCVNKAVEYYTMDDHASDHVVIMQDSSQFYMFLAFFEEDESKKYKLYKKRTEILNKTVTQLNESCYLDLCREMWFDLGFTNSYLADIKSTKYSQSRSSQTGAKLNSILLESINFFQKYINSFNDRRTNKTPERFPVEFERNVLMCHLCIAQAHSKFVNLDRNKAIELVQQSLHYYQKIVDYCDKNRDASKEFLAELGMCKDMLHLLPLKLQKLIG